MFKCQHNRYLGDIYDGKFWWFYDEKTFLWGIDKSGLHIHQTLIDTVHRDFVHLRDCAGANPTTKYVTTKAIDKLVANINKQSFCKNLVADCCLMFMDSKFVSDKLDSKPNLVACTNSVFDINAGGLRDGHAYDYITLSTH